MKLLSKTLSVLILLIGSSLLGQTCLPTTISTDLVLTKAGSPYQICDTTTIQSGASLTIEAGTKIFLDSKLIVNGTFIAEGNETDSVFFDNSNSGGFFDKKEFVLDINATGEMNLSYVKSHDLLTITCNHLSGSNTDYIKNSSFINFNIEVSSSTIQKIVIDSCKFSKSIFMAYSVSNSEFEESRINNCYIIENNTFQNCSDLINQPLNMIIGNTFVQCYGAIIADENNLQIINNTFESVEHPISVHEGDISTYTISGNHFCLDGESKLILSFTQASSPLNLICNTFCFPVDEIEISYNGHTYNINDPVISDVFILNNINCPISSGCLPSTINSDITLTKANSPYTVCYETTITETGSMIIESGVELFFEEELIVKGALIIIGTVNDTVLLDGGDSDGIPVAINVIETGSLDMQYASCRAVSTPIFLSINSDNNHSIENSKFDGYNIAITVRDNGLLNICSSHFTESNLSNTGIRLSKVDSCKISGCHFEKMGLPIISFGTNFIFNNVIDGSGDLNAAIVTGGGAKIFNNIISNSSVAAILIIDSATVINNKFIDNNVGITSSTTINNSTIIEQNDFCGNNLNIENNPGLNINATNCFCDNGSCFTGLNTDFDCSSNPFEKKCLPVTISGDLTLTKSGSPYTICEETTITETGNLTIEPGVELIFDNSLIVNGVLNVNGTENDSVKLIGDSELDDRWNIYFEDESSSKMSYVEYSSLAVWGSHNRESYIITMDNSKIYDAYIANIDTICSSFFSNTRIGNGKVISNSQFNNTNVDSPTGGVYNCLFKNCEEALQLETTARVIGNTFQNCETAILTGVPDVEIESNYFENNTIALELSSDTKINKNEFCGNDIIVLIHDEDISNLQIGNNCFCEPIDSLNLSYNSSTETINKSSFDYILDPTLVNTNCTTGYDSSFTSCDNIRNFSDTIEDVSDTTKAKTFFISGLAHTGTDLLTEGYAFLYSSKELGFEPIAIDTIENGDFFFEKINSGIYTILITTLDNDYEPTYFVNKSSINIANTIPVYGDITEVDIWLNSKDDSEETGVNNYKIVLDKGNLEDGRYPLIIGQKLGSEIANPFSVIAEVNNGQLTADLENLTEDDYLITIPKNGFTNYTLCLNQSANDYIIDTVCIISGTNAKREGLSFDLSPNPSSSIISFDFSDNGKYTIRNNIGTIKQEGVIEANYNSLDVSNLEKGIYFITIYTNDDRGTKSFIKIE